MGKIFKNDIPYSGDEGLDENVVAGPYTPNLTYHAKECCMYGGKLYKCKSTTTGNWDSTKWDEVKITELITEAQDPKWGEF